MYDNKLCAILSDIMECMSCNLTIRSRKQIIGIGINKAGIKVFYKGLRIEKKNIATSTSNLALVQVKTIYILGRISL